MNNNFEYLPKYTLNQLADRVAMKVDYFNRLYKPDNIWNGIIESCQTIEEEPRNVSTVIVDMKKENEIAVSGTSIKKYHCKLTCVYILLYYRYRDDDLYKALVFPYLIQNMGVYSGSQIINDKINQEIDKIIELDKIVEEKQKSQKTKPLFAFHGLNGNNADKLFDEYSDERLFREMNGIIEALNNDYSTRLDTVVVWYNAKLTLQSLQQVKRPELFIERVATALVNGQINNGYSGSQIILICVYAMVRSKDNPHFKSFITKMEDMAIGHLDMEVIHQNIINFKDWIDKSNPYDSYDYFGLSIQEKNTFTIADIERMMQEFTTKIKELDTLVKQKDVIIADYQQQLNTKTHEEDTEEEKEQEDVLYNKVCFEFFLLLLEASGLDINITGNKTRVGELWHMFTGKSANDIRRYCSMRKPVNSHTKEDAKKLNEKLKEMGINIHIEPK